MGLANAVPRSLRSSMGFHISRLLDVASYVSTGCVVKSRQCLPGNSTKRGRKNEVPATVILCIHLLSADSDVGLRAGAACKPEARTHRATRPAEGLRQPGGSS